jgi:hypothetical protein
MKTELKTAEQHLKEYIGTFKNQLEQQPYLEKSILKAIESARNEALDHLRQQLEANRDYLSNADNDLDRGARSAFTLRAMKTLQEIKDEVAQKEGHKEEKPDFDKFNELVFSSFFREVSKITRRGHRLNGAKISGPQVDDIISRIRLKVWNEHIQPLQQEITTLRAGEAYLLKQVAEKNAYIIELEKKQ